MSDFLSNLGDVLSQQFELGENRNKSLDIVKDGTVQKYGRLGDFAKKIDQTAERSYYEEGYLNSDKYNQKPKQLDIILQEPNITVLVKKRAFASLAENFRPDLMDEHEKLFYKATKILFANKCKQISAYEKLSKIEKISSDVGGVNYHLLPILFSLTDSISEVPGALGFSGTQNTLNSSLGKFKAIVDRVREVIALNQDTNYTTWINGIPNSFRSGFGEGTGVIELTNITSLNTKTNLKFASGSFSINFNDPYKSMVITNLDIEKALSDATNLFYNSGIFQLGITSLNDTIAVKKRQLNLMRERRKVNAINFIVEPDTFLGKRVRAIIDILGAEIIFSGDAVSNLADTSVIDPSSKQGSEDLQDQGLSDSEIIVFNDIVSSLFTQISLITNSRRQSVAINQDASKNLNSIRKKLKLHYGGKLIVQPMDNVHIYINSKKTIDNKIAGGLQNAFSANGFTSGANSILGEVKDLLSLRNDNNLEKAMYVGNDFPNWLWLIMRDQFVSDRSGTHVFGGIVDSAPRNSNGKTFTASVSGSDNAGYFKYGVVNFKPSIDVFNGSLFDTLTPFKMEFDSTTGIQKTQSLELLDENQGLFESSFVKNKSGLYAGLKPTENNFLSQDADRTKNDSTRRVFYDPDGMVYRNKEGIASLVLFGDSYEENPNVNNAPSITSEPFAGQDIMNALSIIISGEPYNFSTFYRAALGFDNFKRDPQTNRDPSGSYFKGLRDQLKERNAIYGNFIPFKTLTVDEDSYRKIINNELTASSYDADLRDLVKKRAELGDKLAIIGKTTLESLSNEIGGAPADSRVASALKALDEQIQDKLNKINEQFQNRENPPITVIGNNISFDYEDNGLTDGNKTRLDNSRKDLRRKVSALTKRPSWKVRANEDVNLLIVDDTYDKDYDIQAFEKSIVNPELFKSEYLTVAGKIESLMNVIQGFEIFCNTQGHIEIRAPRYNRVPSSVFYKMLRMKDDLGIQIFPQFIEDLFANQIDELFNNISVLEDEIRMYCLALGNSTDDTCINFINSSDKSLSGLDISRLSNIGGFKFISEEVSGNISGGIKELIKLSQPDTLINYIQTKLSALEPQQSNSIFGVGANIALVQQSVMPPLDPNNPTQFANLSTIRSSAASTSRETAIKTRLQAKTGQAFDLNQLFNKTNNSSIRTTVVSTTDILQIADGISTRLAKRQAAIKMATNALKNVKEGVSLTTDSGKKASGNKLLYPNLYNTNTIPKAFEHMIEDETYDDLGVGSRNRFVIKNRDIIRYGLAENKPAFTYVEVNGRVDNFVKNSDLPQDLNIGSSGNAVITASAIDYDMYRMYGLHIPQTIEAPFLSDPNTQCAPYAVSLLNTARRDILKGTATIVGNEFQQPGEVVYLEEEDLLFYVEEVAHNFAYGSGFTTDITLSYGHNVGEYIPTFLDVIGKVLYKNKDISHFVHKRQGNVFNQEHIGTIVGNITSSANTTVEEGITSGTFGESNRYVLQNIIQQAAASLNTGDNYLPMLEIRIFYNAKDSNFSTPNDYTVSLQNAVLDYLIGRNDLFGNTSPTGQTKEKQKTLSAFKSQILPVAVNASDEKQGEFRSPSGKAFSFARDIINKKSNNSSNNLQQKIDTAIYNYIVDCWIVFSNPNNKSA